MFIDKVSVSIAAGDGGAGRVSFRREKFVAHGGPDGGDGGDGASVILEASRNQNTLAKFRYDKEIKGKPGEAGDKRRKHGRRSRDLIVPVPVGTIATREDGTVLADLTHDGEQVLIARGGKGGFGNAHFVSSRRQAPNFAEKGEVGESFSATFELKMIADVGLIGMPNAGKSTLLSVVSMARPEIADYAFTTLTPNLGMVDIDKDFSALFADIPGLIEGASEGKGLGHEFLRHVERTAVIVHLIDAYQPDVATTYQAIRKELKLHQASLADRQEVVVLNKVEGLDEDIINDLLAQLRKVVPKNTPLLAISAQAQQGIKELLYTVKSSLILARQAMEAAKPEEEALPVITLKSTDNDWQVTRRGKVFVVTGPKIERFAGRTDFSNEEGVQRLRDIMKRMGIMHELVRQSIEADQEVRVGPGSFKY